MPDHPIPLLERCSTSPETFGTDSLPRLSGEGGAKRRERASQERASRESPPPIDHLQESDLLFETIAPTQNPTATTAIRALLAASDLGIDAGVEVFVVGYLGSRLVACAGLEKNIVKCVAIDSELRGAQLALRLMNEIAHLAMARGQAHLFLYTKPENRELFEGCGFYPLVEAPDGVCLMENTPRGARAYAERLAKHRRPGKRIGAIVLNANPFTLGHQHLVRTASEACDFVHLFVVSEDASFFSFPDRLNLVREGVAPFSNVEVYPGSEYMVSKTTFPSYFLKERGKIERFSAAIDLLLFGEFIAPPLGVTHRYVGAEPFCRVTRQYNAEMREWLRGIEVVEVPRSAYQGRAISATEVRQLLRQQNFSEIASRVPETTFRWLRDHYSRSTVTE